MVKNMNICNYNGQTPSMNRILITIVSIIIISGCQMDPENLAGKSIVVDLNSDSIAELVSLEIISPQKSKIIILNSQTNELISEIIFFRDDLHLSLLSRDSLEIKFSNFENIKTVFYENSGEFQVDLKAIDKNIYRFSFKEKDIPSIPQDKSIELTNRYLL